MLLSLNICAPAFTAFPAVLVNDSAAGLAGKTLCLLTQKSDHVLLGIVAVLYQVHIIFLPVSIIKAVYPLAGKLFTLKAPPQALIKGAVFLLTVPAAFSRDLLLRRAAARTGVFLVQTRAARKTVYPAGGNHIFGYFFRHFHKGLSFFSRKNAYRLSQAEPIKRLSLRVSGCGTRVVRGIPDRQKCQRNDVLRQCKKLNDFCRVKIHNPAGAKA